MAPTTDLYASLQVVYEHFNQTLFKRSPLPNVMFTAQRQKSMMGYFSPERWTSKSGKNCHELAINPSYVGRSAIIELLQTLVHEMVHCWQYCYGKPGRANYHNKEWANKMESIGLMPSSTGKPGGRKTGQSMSDYPIVGGEFILQCRALVLFKNFELPWVDRYAQVTLTSATDVDKYTDALTGIDGNALDRLTTSVSTLFDDSTFVQEPEIAAKKVKIRYTCRACLVNVWGKAGLNISCNDCNVIMHETNNT